MWKYLITWLVMLLISIANGAVRDFTYGKHIDDLTTHQLSTLSGVLLLSIIIWVYVKLYQPSSSKEAVLIGLLWMLLTIAFEFLFFHYVANYSWTELLANYNIFKGRVWIILLVWITIAPYIFFRLKNTI
jgi:hypothetical protein